MKKDRNKNIENLAWWWVCGSTIVQVPTRFEKGLEHGWVVDYSVDFFYRRGIQYDIWYPCVWGCENVDGCGGVVGGGLKNCLRVYGIEKKKERIVKYQWLKFNIKLRVVLVIVVDWFLYLSLNEKSFTFFLFYFREFIMIDWLINKVKLN